MSEKTHSTQDPGPESALAGDLPAGSERLAQALQDAPDETGATISTDTVGVATGRTGGGTAGQNTDSARGATSGDTSGEGTPPGETSAGRGAVAED